MQGFFKQQKFKRSLAAVMSGLMIAVLLATSVPELTKEVLADEDDVIVKLTTDVTEVKAGDTLTATLSVEKNAGLAALVVRFGYDQDVLSLVSVEQAKNSAFKDTVLFPVKELLKDQTQTLDEASNGIVGMAYAGVSKTEAKGNVMTATFKVKDNAKVGHQQLWFTYLDASDAGAKELMVGAEPADFEVAATIVVEPDSDDQGENEAAKEVAKIVKQLFEDEEEVKGIDERLARKIIEAVSEYKEVTVEVQKESVAEEDIPQEEAALVKEQLTEERQAAAYFDIDMVVKIDGEEKGTIKEVEKPIAISVKIPENLPEVEEGYVRIYFILRIHDGKVEELPATVTGDMVSFRSNKFSTYMLGYVDSKGVKGDVNGDTLVNIADALMISRLDAGLIELDEATKALGDVNNDTSTDIADALMISRLDAGLIEGF